MAFGGFLGSPGFQFLASLLSSWGQQGATDQANQRTDEQIMQALGLASNRAQEGLNIYDDSARSSLNALIRGIQQMNAGAQQLPGLAEADRVGFLNEFDQNAQQSQYGYGMGMENFLRSLSGESDAINAGYRDRYNLAERELEGYGEQQRADIDRLFDNERGRVEQDLISRGVLSSTAGGQDLLNVGERRSAEQRRLAEDLARNRINVLSGLSGEGLAAQERLQGQQAGYEFGGMNTAFANQSALDASRAAYDAAMRGDVRSANQLLIDYQQQGANNLANWYGTNAANRANQYMQGTGDWLNTLTNINYVPPPDNNLPFIFGQNAVQPAQPQGNFLESLIGPLIGAGGAVAGGALAGGALSGGAGALLGAKFFFFCIDGEALIETADGKVPLRDVVIGDSVLSTDGTYAKVTDKDYGRPHADRFDDFVRLTAPDGRSLILTVDHPIEDEDAGAWEMESVGPVLCGDLLLENERGYIANGVPVASMMALMAAAK